ncbi:membrane protein [Agromyces luteolus]|uniref:anthrone oxygenase family protein n=1 Tax=Agromyces luteolus TaxID=88373 RepID=UPI0012DE849C|nr:anthrone oxygenase family protein [Agromyces luteolus]GLK26079.1 membrane protein [Agromyces luteolus]
MDLLIAGILVAVVGTGVAAGVFFAFSAFVVQGLDRLPEADAARAMRAVNVTAVRWPLMLELFGTALLLAVLAVASLLRPGSGITWWVVASAALYLVTVVFVTGGGNVPRNNALAAAPDEPEGLAAAWRAFRAGWMGWNHVRTLGAAASSALLAVGLVAAG